MTALWLLAAAACLHAGFQVTVTVLVYPALAETPDETWHQVHGRHSRRIVPLVGAVYGLGLAAGVAVLADVGEATRGGAQTALLAVGAVVLVATAMVTAAAAAPLHGRLGEPSADRSALTRRLLAWDRLRATLAVLAAAALVLASL